MHFAPFIMPFTFFPLVHHADQIKKMKDQSSDKAILNKEEVFDFNAALLKWKVSKDRRIYELKKLK